MTLIVGVRCSDGVVLGADGAATYGNVYEHTIQQSTKKLRTISGSLVVGVSGSVGLSQFILAAVEKVWHQVKADSRNTPEQLRVALSSEIRKYLLPELSVAAEAAKLLGSAAHSSAMCSALVAMPKYAQSQDGYLFEFDHQGSSEEKINDGSFVAIGSGQGTADPFLAFLRKVFWKDTQPSIVDGIFATVWTLCHTIETSPGGVSFPIQIITLRNEVNRGFVATELSQEQVEEHRESTGDAERMLLEWRRQQRDKTPPPGEGPPEYTPKS
ncbi:hypothetical protein EHM69_05250 [candidate division KSB1 bacterium]|nr:MAG: hypothetical protein EHM69_05250 [candidate division KSB1 bacterium]